MPTRLVLLLLAASAWLSQPTLAGHPVAPTASSPVYVLCQERFVEAEGAPPRCVDVAAQWQACRRSDGGCHSWELARILFLSIRLDSELVPAVADALVRARIEDWGEDDVIPWEDDEAAYGLRALLAYGRDPSGGEAGTEWIDRLSARDRLVAATLAAPESATGGVLDPVTDAKDFACWFLQAPERPLLLQIDQVRDRLLPETIAILRAESAESADQRWCAMRLIELSWGDFTDGGRATALDWLQEHLVREGRREDAGRDLGPISSPETVLLSNQALAWPGIEQRAEIVDSLLGLATLQSFTDPALDYQLSAIRLGLLAQAMVPTAETETSQVWIAVGVSPDRLAAEFFWGEDWINLLPVMTRSEIVRVLDAIDDPDDTINRTKLALHLHALRQDSRFVRDGMIQLRILDVLDRHVAVRSRVIVAETGATARRDMS